MIIEIYVEVYVMRFTAMPFSEEHLEAVAILEDMFPDAWGEQSLKAELANKASEAFVLLEDEEIVGFCAFTVAGEEANLNTLAIDPLFQRKGAASTLLLVAFETLKAKNVKEVYLEVRASNRAAISLYEKIGFHTIGERKDFYKNPKEHAILMQYLIDDER